MKMIISHIPTSKVVLSFPFLTSCYVLRLRQSIQLTFFQCVHCPYPMVEVLMFPASGVGLEADGCWQRKGFGKQWVSNRWKGAYASKSPQPASSPVTNCGKIWLHPGWGWIEDHGEEWSVLRIEMVIWDQFVSGNLTVGIFRPRLIGDEWRIVAKNLDHKSIFM